MLHSRCRNALAFTALLAACVAPSTASRADEAAAAAAAQRVAPFVGEQTLAVVRIDVARLPIDTLADRIGPLLPGLEAELPAAKATAKAIQKVFLNAGAPEVFLVIAKDFYRNQPGFVLVIPKTETTDVEALTQTGLMPGAETAELHESLVIGKPDALAHLKNQAARNALGLTVPLAELADSAVQFVVIPSADDRRVVAELLPRLPEAIGGGPSTPLSQGLLWLGMGLGGGDKLELRLVVQAADQEAARELQTIWRAGLKSLAEVELVRRAVPDLQTVQPILTPEIQGDQLELHLHEENQSMQTLLAALKPPLEQARLAAGRAVSMNHLRQIALAMHNYYDVHKHFPAVGTFDDEGRPLLSWRVHLLPYLGEEELYRQFRLDEPWDSAHNKPLIARMPAVFASPASKHPRGQGLATYRVVEGEGTIFSGRQGTEFKDITDGSSNTVLAVEVDDQHAIEWTRPQGLPLDPDNPLKGIGGQFPDGFHVAGCDGAGHFLPNTIDPKQWLLLLLRADGQPVNWN